MKAISKGCNSKSQKALHEYNLKSMAIIHRHCSFKGKLENFRGFIEELKRRNELSFFRVVHSPMDREVWVTMHGENKPRKMLMFGSNNYLGFADDRYIKEKVCEAIKKFGVGVAGPPILNGYSKLTRKLELRLANLKGCEDAMLFPSGFQTNLGLISALFSKNDNVLFDELSHASFYAGLKQSKARSCAFRHNDLQDLESKILEMNINNQLFIGVEGLYSMDGDLSPLDKILKISNKNNAICVLDDAHGTGLLGQSGGGTHEHFNVPDGEIVFMGTFSKCFSVNGGFIAAKKEIIEFLRYHAKPYMFSASLSPAIMAAVHAGIDLIETEGWRRDKIRQLRDYAVRKLQKFDFVEMPEAAIIAIHVPHFLNIRRITCKLHRIGFFVNAVEYPAVPENKQRLRISLMINHTFEDIDTLCNALEVVWNDESMIVDL